MLLKLAIASTLVLLAGAPVLAQGGATSSIVGVVTDNMDAVVPGAMGS